jgi:thermitase
MVRHLHVPGLALIRIRAGASVQAVASTFAKRPDVAYAEPNYIYPLAALPNDPRFGDQWALHNVGQTVKGVTGAVDADIDAPEAWNVTKGNAAVKVAVLDSGVAYDHPDLSGNIWSNPGETGLDGSGRDKRSNGRDDDGNGYVDDFRGWDFFDWDNDPYDTEGHGTNVASIVGAAGNNGVGGTGISHTVKLIPLRVAAVYTTADVLAEAFTYAGEMGAKVAQASVGNVGYSQAVSDAISGASGTLVVAAAHNQGSNNEITPIYPCNYTAANLLCVAATDQSDQLAPYSNYGSTAVDLAAPGSIIFGALPSYATVFSEGFETAITGRWTTGGTRNTWGRSTGAAATGVYGVTESPAGNYQNNTSSYARTTNAIDLRGRRGCLLDYSMRLDAVYPDTIYVEALRPGDPGWITMDAWSFSDPEWFEQTISLEPFDGQQIYIRFYFLSNGSGTGDGAHIDDLAVRCRDSYSGDEYGFYQGTSQAAPQVSGVAALLIARFPTATIATVRSKILNGVDRQPSLAGKTVTGGRLNAYKALAETTAKVTTLANGSKQLVLTAGTGVANDLRLSLFTDTDGVQKVRVDDPYSTNASGEQIGSRLVAGTGCQRGASLSQVKCAAAGIASIIVNAGDGNDVVSVGVGLPTTVNGAAGKDRIVGGSGVDSFFGGSGNDTIDARDGRRDGRISCGETPGATDADAVTADAVDPVDADCESVSRS